MSDKRRKGQQRTGTCVYCGVTGPVERDHPIPQALFRVLDENMVTVPACKRCNRKKSYGDRDLRNYVTMDIGGSQHPDALWHAEKMANSNIRTRLWLQSTIETARQRPLVNEEGLVLSYALENDFNKEPFIQSLRMTIRGLYFHETDRVLPVDCDVSVVEVGWSNFSSFMKGMAARLPGTPTVKGNLVAWWKYSIAADSSTDSVWALCFNDRVAFLGTIGRLAIALRNLQQRLQAESEYKDFIHRLIQGLDPAPIRIPRSSDGRLLIP